MEIKAIICDADDTLWSNEPLFRNAEQHCFEILKEYGTPEWLNAELYRTETDNMEELGYGAKAFILSMIETAVRVSGGKISAEKILQLEQTGRAILRNPATPLDGVEEISKHVDALLVINNEKLSEIYSELSVDDAFDKADDTLSVAAKSIAEIITLHGKVNLDFNDVKTVLKDGGVAIMSTGYGEGDNRVSEAIKNAQHSPLLNNNDIFNSKKVLLNISYSSQYKLMMSEMDEVKEFMNRFSRDFETKFGMAIDDKLEQKVKITLLATGFGIKDIHMKEMDERITQRTAEEQQRLVELEEEEEQRRNRREVYYGKDANARSQRSRRRHIYLFNPEDMDNADIIAMVENSPTYLRDKSTLNSIKMKAEQEGQLATEAAQEATGGAGETGVITF